jgi:hypothetical protein
MSCYTLWHAECLVATAEEAAAAAGRVDSAMMELACACRWAASLADSELRDALLSLQRRAERARVQLAETAAAEARAAADRFLLTPPDSAEILALTGPRIEIPADLSLEVEAVSSIERRRELAFQNLQWTPRLAAIGPDGWQLPSFSSALD